MQSFNFFQFSHRFTAAVCACFLSQTVLPPSACGQVNSWTNPASARWHEPFWSLGVLPSPSQHIELTNSGWKAVEIGSSTVQAHPDSLTISSLNIAGPPDARNVLLLNHIGITLPLRVLDRLSVSTNGRLTQLHSDLKIGSGGLRVSGGEVNQDGGSVVVDGLMAMGGSYNLTNGLLQTDQVSLSLAGEPAFVQHGGMVHTRIVRLAGTGQTAYHLMGGAVFSTNVTLGGGNHNSRFLQTGGTNTTDRLSIQGYFGRAEYLLADGLLTANQTELYGSDYNSAKMEQTGGRHVITHRLHLFGGLRHGATLYPGSYALSGGELEAQSIEVGPYARLAISNGTAIVTGDVLFEPRNAFARVTSVLAGGTIICGNLIATGSGADLEQSAGSLVISNLLSFAGFAENPPLGLATYKLSGGTLNASNIELTARLLISSGLPQRISNPGLFSLGGILVAENISESLGRFALLSSATIDMGGGAGRLRFLQSSSSDWAAGALLYITNWSGSLSGGGADQLMFGDDANGLTSAQLGKIRFANVNGLPGIYAARILPTGEVVPREQGSLRLTRHAHGLVLSWLGSNSPLWATNAAGPYQAMPSVSSPWLIDTAAPASFFWLPP